MGIELDILTGHPEHDILFIATQVARAAGLKYPSQSVAHVRTQSKVGIHLQEIQGNCIFGAKPGRIRKDAVLFTEAETYQMLLRGHAPASEPFRKWVTEIVLPTIRKTGSFDVNDATDETSQQFAGEFAALHAEVQGLKAMVQQLLDRAAAPVESPYEGTTLASLADGLLFEPRAYREVGEAVGLGRIALDLPR